MQAKRIRIVSDGTPRGTKVFDADGEPFDMSTITAVEWSIDADGAAIARLTFCGAEIDVIGDLSE